MILHNFFSAADHVICVLQTPLDQSKNELFTAHCIITGSCTNRNVYVKLVEKIFQLLIVNHLTLRVKPWKIQLQSFLTFDSTDRTLKCDHSLQSC